MRLDDSQMLPHSSHDKLTGQLTRVLDRFYLGNFQVAQSLAKTNPHRVQTVITLCADRVQPRRSSILYRHFPISDSRAIPSATLAKILNAIDDAVKQGATLLHCQAGLCRTPIVAAAYLFHRGCGTYAECLCYLTKLRPQTALSLVLVESVMQWLRTSTR